MHVPIYKLSWQVLLLIPFSYKVEKIVQYIKG